ncbi:MAG: hypothetical protein IJC15_08590 [Clostridia bacterium]|nr:hypothetical protein [Clostridia bacterium]
MVELTSRERILRTYRRQEIDRVPMVDSPWRTTVNRWRAEGMPDMDWRDYFGFDKTVCITPDNSPRHPHIVHEQNERYCIETTKWGQKQKRFAEMDSTPESLGFTYDTPERWEEAKARMLAYHEDRIPWKQLEQNYALWKKEGRFMQLGLWFGFDVAHSRLTGTENMLISMYDDPDWVCDIFDTYLTTTLDLAQRILDAGYEFDGIFWWDDMGYKGTTFFSPNTYRELLKPYHKKAVDWAHERGLVAELHSCGYIEPLIPDLVEIGVEMLNPLEIKAGMNPAGLKSTWGDRLAFHGGINAQLWDQPEAVRAEIERIIPVMKEGGGYIFASDHSIPNSVSFETMKMIADYAKELGKY